MFWPQYQTTMSYCMTNVNWTGSCRPYFVDSHCFVEFYCVILCYWTNKTSWFTSGHGYANNICRSEGVRKRKGRTTPPHPLHSSQFQSRELNVKSAKNETSHPGPGSSETRIEGILGRLRARGGVVARGGAWSTSHKTSKVVFRTNLRLALI